MTTKPAFIKDLRFIPAENLKPTALREVMEHIASSEQSLDEGDLNEVGGFQQATAGWIALVRHAKDGAHMYVSKEVSDDLDHSHIDDPDFANLTWPHDRLELYFEDPSLPSFLAQRATGRADYEALNGYAAHDAFRLSDDKLSKLNITRVTLMAMTNGDTPVVVRMPIPDINAFARGDNMDRAEYTDGICAAIRDMTVRLFKVLLFAASDGYAPRVTTERPTKAQGGKPNFKGRPKTKRFIVEYLPRQQVAKKRANAEATRTHNFRGRHGHWRVYKADRYVNMRGRREYMHPIPGPDGKIPPRKFRVIKPKEVSNA